MVKESTRHCLKVISIFLIGFGLGLILYYFSFPSFSSLSSEEMHERIIQERDIGIKKARAQGDYNCCVEPACTMCYMEGNLWNNYQARHCDCDEFIARGKEPCPQCKRILAQEKNSSCALKKRDIECE